MKTAFSIYNSYLIYGILVLVTYTDKKDYSENDLKQLFRSVEWISANYPDRLKKALDNCETVFTA